MPKPWENAEGYHDPTAYHGTKNIIRLAGFELLNRIEIKDRKTGREYK